MIDIDHSVEKLISALPVAPGVPSGLCDRTFLGPLGPADYILHMDPKSQLDVWDSICFVRLISLVIIQVSGKQECFNR